MARAELGVGDLDRLILIETRWTERELVKQLPGSRWDPDLRTWTMPHTWAACLQLRGVFRESLEVGPRLAVWSQDEMRDRILPATRLRTQVDRATPLHGEFDPRLHDFQTAGAAFLPTAGDALLCDDLGMGKTAQVLAALRMLELLDPAEVLPALVICPNSVKVHWEDQSALWKFNATPYVIHGGAAKRRKALADAATDPTALVILNIESVRLFSRLAPFGSVALKRCRECDKNRGEEGLTTSRCEVHPKPLNGFGFKTVIVDEAHRIKDPSSKQTRACWAVGHDPSVRHRFGMTGTPIADNVADLWSIMHFIVPREYPTKSKFVDRYALQAWNEHGGLSIVGVNPYTRDEFFSVLDPRFRRTPKALVLDQLPPVVRPTRWVDMSAKQERAYRDLEARLMTRLEDGGVITVPNNLVRANRLLQLSSSYADVTYEPDPTPEDPENVKIIVRLAEPSSKLDAMEDVLLELGPRQVVIAAQSRQLIELAAKRLTNLKESHGLIVGGVNEYDRRTVLRRFQAGDIRAVLLTIQAGGTGTDGLQVADTMLCLQRSWSMIDNVQLDGRVDRMGSEKHSSVTIIDFVTRDTIEQHVQYPRLRDKFARLDEINRDRTRLEQHGIRSPEMYRLDREIDEIMGSRLNT